jgi:hypothetical protein
MGLGDGIGQKKPCHHLGPFFSNFLPEKILSYLKEFLRKKLKSAKKGDEITPFDGTRDHYHNSLQI